MGLEQTKSYKQFGGFTNYYSHESKLCGGKMNFAAYLPPQAVGADSNQKFPVLYWLSGLTCTEENFITKAYAQIFAAKFGFVVVAPDTSPRGAGVAGEDDSYDLGTGAGFYVDATEAPWSKNYKMYSYVTQELRELAEAKLPIDGKRRAISGHSMGGHGALVLGLRNPSLYRSISAFAPIAAPMLAPWGKKAFSHYLGADQTKWSAYDASELLRKAEERTPVLIDQGLADEFLTEQLMPEVLEKIAREKKYPAEVRRHEGYDHSYFFISTFLESHFAFHAKNLE